MSYCQGASPNSPPEIVFPKEPTGYKCPQKDVYTRKLSLGLAECMIALDTTKGWHSDEPGLGGKVVRHNPNKTTNYTCPQP